MGRRFLAITIIVFLLGTMFFLRSPETQASQSTKPFTPSKVRVLVVSPKDIYYSGAHYLDADLARYGFNVTLSDASFDGVSTDYLTDPKTSDLSQYDVVILHGIVGFSTSMMSAEEVAHFTNYGGVLIVIGNALFVNETSGEWWGFDSEPVRLIEERLGVDFTRFLGFGGAWHNNGTFELMDSSIKGLPPSLSYTTIDYGSITFQLDLDLAPNGAREIYDFTITSSPDPSLIGMWTLGITYNEGVNHAVGVYIQGSYIYGVESGPSKISYFGLTDIVRRSSLLGSLIAYALESDIDTVVKPQPIANIRLDGVGQDFSQTYLNTSLSNFDSSVDTANITPTIGLIDYLDFMPDYWQNHAPEVLSQLKSRYKDWEYGTNLRYYEDPSNMTSGQIEALLDSIAGNYSNLGIDLFSTVIAPGGRWNQSTLDAMASKNLYLIDILDTYYSDWWDLRVNSSIIVHSGSAMLPERVWNASTEKLDWAENSTQPGLDKGSMDFRYFSIRDRLALAVRNGFPSFVYYVPNFRWDDVGTYSLRMVVENLMSEFPDIEFVPLNEAGLYFGNKWMRIENAIRASSVIEFDVDASSIPEVVKIGKGMLWLRINANESIQEVSIDNNGWFYFDDHSIRLPTPEKSVHIRVVLGTLPTPRVVESRFKVDRASYDGIRFNVSISSAENLNVSVRLSIPRVGAFSKDNWGMFCLEQTQWGYNFSVVNRILDFWAISDGFASFEVGALWIIDQTPPLYDSNVTLSANFSRLEIEISQVILCYNLGEDWTNVTATPQDGLWVATIPAMPFGTRVRYRFFAYTTIGKWFATEVVSYDVIDDIPPEVRDFEWYPSNPVAGESVRLKVAVGEPQNASGVKEVILTYYLGTGVFNVLESKTISMTNQNGTWSAEIPGHSGGAVVSFYVTAYDKTGNQEETEHYSYTIWILPISPLLFAFIVGIILVSVAVLVLYLWRLRRKKHQISSEKLVHRRIVPKVVFGSSDRVDIGLKH